jgi:hypothetical protein
MPTNLRKPEGKRTCEIYVEMGTILKWISKK